MSFDFGVHLVHGRFSGNGASFISAFALFLLTRI